MALYEKDYEKHGVSDVKNVEIEQPNLFAYDNGAVPGESFEIGDGWYAKLQRFAGKWNIEQRGIERVPEDERNDHSMLNVSTMWLAANMVASSFAIGVLGPYTFYLGFADSCLVILFFNLIGIMSVSFFSAFGPVFGLRQMVLSRFWFGWWGVKLIALFNLIACIGWSAVNSIVGAQLINAVNNDVPGWAGILIIALCTLFVTIFGYKIVHAYEFWSWIPTFIVFLIILGEFAASGKFQNIPMGVGEAEIGSVLSFGGVVFGFATGWTSYAADYTVYQPSTTSKRKTFFWTWLGLIVPLLFTEMLGAAISTATAGGTEATNPYLRGYKTSANGGLLAAVLFPPLGGFGKFCLVLMALSIIANNCPNLYSVALTTQVLGRWTQAVPRFVWTFVATCIYVAIAIPGYSHFVVALENFMDFIGYWLAAYEGIALTEHFVFKRGFSGYRPEIYDKPDLLPPGIAAVAAFCMGVIGFVMGMSQVWFVGPIAILIGEPPYGGDIGFELAFAFAATSYLVFRSIEKSYFKR